jgi:glycosyltransferase involved in cell wall biosynthesis
MTEAKLSALVVAHDEERNLPGCLESLRFADEIVIVLDRCRDRSRAIAQEFGARIVEGAWPLEGPRRHAGIDACAGPWIFEVDADERVDAALAAEIRARIANAPPGAFLVPMHNYIGARHVRFGWGAYNGIAAKHSLFAKGYKRWGDQRVHPSVTITGARGRLANALDHYVDRSLADTLGRLNRYTSLAAEDAVERGAIPGRWRTARRIFSRAWKSYVARQGFREGFYGVALALFSALYPLFIYLKARELQAQRESRRA